MEGGFFVLLMGRGGGVVSKGGRVGVWIMEEGWVYMSLCNSSVASSSTIMRSRQWTK